jgi:16S rRNA processing protein RimM
MQSWKSSEPPQYLAVARIVAPFGVKGEVRARVLTDFPKRFSRLKTVYLAPEEVLVPVAYSLNSSRLHGSEVLLTLGGVDTPEQADKLRDLLVQVPTAEAVPLKAGHYYHYQILGLAVFTEAGEGLGQVTQILPTGGNDVYVVRGEAGEFLLPAIAQVVRQVDLAAGRMVVQLMDGMRPEAPSRAARLLKTPAPAPTNS